MAPRTFLLGLAGATLLLAACGEEKVTSYRVPKEKEPAAAPEAAPGPAMGDTAVPTADTTLVWQAPPQWTQKPASEMRKASYTVPGSGGPADLSVTAFPGDVGGELLNVNRWRGQIGLPPLQPDELEAAVTRVEANGLKIALVELAPAGDPGGKSMLGAIVPVGGSTWFFKLTGPGESVRAAKPAFLGFLHTVHAP